MTKTISGGGAPPPRTTSGTMKAAKDGAGKPDAGGDAKADAKADDRREEVRSGTRVSLSGSIKKKGEAAVVRRARAEAARSNKAARNVEEPRMSGDFDGAADDGDDAITGHNHKRPHQIHKSFNADDADDLLKSEAEAESGAVTGLGVSRKGMGGGMGGDGFEGGGQDRNREAYEQYLRGNVKSDKERFDALRNQGAADTFRPDMTSLEVEQLGHPRAAVHIVRLYDALTLEGRTHEECVKRASDLLVGFSRSDGIRKVLTELESKPIRDVYPLEVMMKILDERPEALPGISYGAVIGNAAELASGEKAFAGHPFPVAVPADARIKAFALLGGARPGYEFFPSHESGKYTMQVDTAGTWRFALLAVPLTQLGRIQRESGEGFIEIFTVRVRDMGRKGEPAELFDDDDGFDDEPEQAALVAEAAEALLAKPAPSLFEQVRAALDRISRHDVDLKTTTYSWDVSLYRPGQPMTGEPILHVVVDDAGPFDAAWGKAREAIAKKQMEYEPGRRPMTLEDMQFALKRARVR